MTAPTQAFDYIIIGAGSAGSVLANRLSRDPARSVLLVEAGGNDHYPWIHIPVGYLYCIGNPRTDWCYQTEPDPGLHGRSIRYPRGKGLGGSSLINGMIYMRGQREDYDEWVACTGDPDWSWNAILPFFQRDEDYHGGRNAWHGSGGVWRVERQRLHWKVLDVFRQAAHQTGLPDTPDFNRGDNFGVGYFDVNQTRGWRLNAGQAFLKPIRQRPNLTILTHAAVDRLQLDSAGKRCTGIRFIQNRQQREAAARREVLVCAGALGSVALLERSGIGNGKYLQPLGIPVRHHLPGVGENLQDHLQLRMVFKVSGLPTLNTRNRTWWGKAGIALEYLFNRSGPMAMAPSQLGAFARSSPDHPRPNLEYHVQPLSLEKFGEPLHPFNAFTASVCDLHPTSRGHVHITSPDPQAKPRLVLNYLSTAEDRQVAADALKLTRRIVSAPAFRPWKPEEILPGLKFDTDTALASAAGHIGTTIFHPTGTCRMGRAGDPGAVLDSHLKVQGLDGLRVVDGSAMPTITSGNTAAPIMMMAERISDLILAGNQRSTTMMRTAASLANQLALALRESRRLPVPVALQPANREAAYQVQQEILQALGDPVAGWKVGTAPPPDAVWGAPLPRRCVHTSPARIAWQPGSVYGAELELAFRFCQDFPENRLPDSDEAILENIESMALALEVVSTRYQNWPDIPDLLKLADLQNHGFLVLGPPVPYLRDFPFLSPRLALEANSRDVSRQPPGNPAGDPRRLLAPFIRQCAARSLPVKSSHWVTTGSYSGIHFLTDPADLVGTMENLPQVVLSLS